jgi:acyl-CoA synthetase (NDP forming)/RimJ/RimL family protein N-acetyltransferase
VVLRDGGTVHIRPIIPADVDRLTAFHQRQSAESIYYRYFSARPRLSQKDLVHLTHIDYVDRVAFVALLGDDLVGVGRYERWGDRPSAEVAFFIDDAHAQRGLASVFLEYLVAAARERGLATFTASVLPDNSKMLTVFSTAGFEVSRTFADGVIEVSFDLHPTPDAEAARERREATAAAASVRRLFTPTSVAVIGAGSTPGSLGHEVLYNLLAQRFTGTVWAVNERTDIIGGLPAYRTILDIPSDVDLAVIATPAERVADSVELCVRKHVKAVVILTAGFSETGPEGADLEAEVVATARRGGVRVLGPNCLGLVNTDPSVRLHATFAPTAPLPGNVGILAQSGTLSAAIIDRTRRVGLGVSSFVAAGNRADIGASDLMRYWCDEPQTSGVMLYLESFGRIERFVRAARALTATKPVVAVAAGSSLSASPLTKAEVDSGLNSGPDAGARLRQRIAGAVFRQTGIIRVGTLHQLLDVGRLLATQGIPQGIGVTVLGNSGGAVDLAVGECAAAGLTVAARRLSWRADATAYAEALTEVLTGDDSASVLVVHAPPELRPNPAVNEVILDAAERHPDKVIAVCNFDAADVFGLSRGEVTVPVFEFPEHAARALGRLAGYWAWTLTHIVAEPVDKAGSDVTTTPATEPDDGANAGFDQGSTPEALSRRVRDLLATHGSGALPIGAEDELLKAAGVPIAPRVVVASAGDAAPAADTLGYPVTVKGATRDRVLRSEAGGVSLDLHDPTVVEDAALRLVERFGDGATPLVVQRMIDVAVTFRRLPGVTTLTVGMGGVFSDEDDAALGVLPASRTDLAMLIGATTVGRQLGRVAGTEGLIEVVTNLAALMKAAPEIATLVANPIIAGRNGVTLSDVVVELSEPPPEDLAARRLDLDPEE